MILFVYSKIIYVKLGNILKTIKWGDKLKNKLLYIALFCVLLVGVSTLQVKAIENTLKVIDSRTTVNRGETGYITIQGKPDTKYVIETNYKANSKIINITQTHKSGSDGIVTFKWLVGPQTESGTHSALIFGGGESITLSHTVP